MRSNSSKAACHASSSCRLSSVFVLRGPEALLLGCSRILSNLARNDCWVIPNVRAASALVLDDRTMVMNSSRVVFIARDSNRWLLEGVRGMA